MGRLERIRRHLRQHLNHAVLGGISTSAIIAGFMNATNVYWPLLRYVEIAAAATFVVLIGEGLVAPRHRYLLLAAAGTRRPPRPVRPRQLPLVVTARSAPVRQVAAARCDDPIYGAGFRALCGPGEPLVVIASNRRDVSSQHELLFPMFTTGRRHSEVKMDLLELGIPIDAYSFERELPDGSQDRDHTLAIKDLVYLPELGQALAGVGASNTVPLVWPEHCVDPLLLADRDVIVVGGPDTNFWHGALFEPVVKEFAQPKSSVPLALELRDGTGQSPIYGSRVLVARLAGLDTVLPGTPETEVELDERLYPAYGMLLACRNPYAAALRKSRWCVFVAGTRSLGTSAGVLALSLMLRAMRDDPACNFASRVRTTDGGVLASVSALLYRTSEVERAMIRRDGEVLPRERRGLSPAGPDPNYSDTYVPTEVEYLGHDTGEPRWQRLGS